MYCAVIIGLLVATVTSEFIESANYQNYRVYEVTASSDGKLKILQDLESSSDSVIFLEPIYKVNKMNRVVVAPHKLPDFLELLNENDIDYKLVERNLQRQFDSMDREMRRSRNLKYGWTTYQELPDTYEWMGSLEKTYPEDVTVIEMGRTYQNRSILGVKISKSTSSGRAIFVEAGIHSREWIAPATATYLINQLLTSTDPNVQKIAGGYDWYIVPHANPDGYVYSYTTNRMWRKTRRPYGICFGADPNRNWGFDWNSVGSSSNPCTDTFAGASAFSEIETRSLSDYIKSLKGKLGLYISFHAYSQLLLYPYGSTSNLPENNADYKRVFDATVTALKKRHGTHYTGGNIYDAIYPASGSSIDWAFAKDIAPMSFCYELRPSSDSHSIGFALPASQIIPTGEETVDSLVAMVNTVNELGYFK